jgi:hypothetical protein
VTLFMTLSIWTQGFTGTKQTLPLEPCHQPFLFWLFWDRVLLYVQVSLAPKPPICASSYSWGGRCTPLLPATGWDGASWTSRPCWPQTAILPISVF